MYGHMVIGAPSIFYAAVFLLITIFACLLSFKFLFSMNKADRILALIVTGFIFLAVFASNFHSWTYDYQPQGRYLFPVVGIIAIGVNHLAKYFSQRYIVAFIGAFYLLSVYSFTCIGIPNFN